MGAQKEKKEISILCHIIF